MTNGDYIRQMMTDEYIAQEFCDIAFPFSMGCVSCPIYRKECTSYEVRLKWLKEEHVEEKEE